MERIETVAWEPIPDKPDYVRKRGPRKVSDVFAELEAALKSANLYPDEYFVLDKDFADENMLCPEFEDVICYAQWGGNEGIYLEVDIVYRNEETDTYVRKNFATGKTLSDDSRSYDRMQYIAGYIYKLFMGDKQIPARYMIVGKKEVGLREQLHARILMEYESYVKNIFVHKPLNPADNGAELAIRSLVLHNLFKCELPDEKMRELLDSDDSLELLTKICRHVLEADSFEISDTICACLSFKHELEAQEKRHGEARDVVVDEKSRTVHCPRCNAYLAEDTVLKEIDEPVPKHCHQCGQKLHY